MNGLDAWDMMLGEWLSDEDQNKLEWAIGSVFSNGPKKILVIEGPSPSGKSTVLKFIWNMVVGYHGDHLSVKTIHDGVHGTQGGVRGMRAEARDAFLFVATNTPIAFEDRDDGYLVKIQTTGRMLVERDLREFTALVEDDHASIIDHCVNYYQENSK